MYKHGGEDHLVLSFFENFVLDQQCDWVARIGARLGLLKGHVLAANWSYAFEEKLTGEKRPRIADLVLHWRDEQGDAVVLVEAKKPGAVPSAGLNAKDDPRYSYYLQYTQVRNVARRAQMLLVSEKDMNKLDAELRDDPRVVTWEEFSALQVDVLTHAVPAEMREIVVERLRAHHAELGLTRDPRRVLAAKLIVGGTPISENLAAWLRGTECYFAARHNGSVAELPLPWLQDEPSRVALLGSGRQSTRDRELPLWQIL